MVPGLAGALVLLLGCPSGDDEGSTTVSMTSGVSTGDTTAGPGSGGSESSASSSTGTNGPEVCEQCDTTTEYCRASFVDGPTTYSCEPFPAECTKNPNCDCIAPVVCEALQACNKEGELVVVECVDG